MIVKSGIKTWTMLSGLVLALVLVTGCNSGDEPAAGGAAGAPTAAPAGKMPEGAAPTTPAPASKPEEK